MSPQTRFSKRVIRLVPQIYHRLTLLTHACDLRVCSIVRRAKEMACFPQGVKVSSLHSHRRAIDAMSIARRPYRRLSDLPAVDHGAIPTDGPTLRSVALARYANSRNRFRFDSATNALSTANHLGHILSRKRPMYVQILCSTCSMAERHVV